MPIRKSEEILSMNQNPRITWEGCRVLLYINDGDRLLFARLTTGSKIKIGNKNCSLQPLIRCAFGSSFQVAVGEDGPFLSRIFPSAEEREQLGMTLLQVSLQTVQRLRIEQHFHRKSIGSKNKKNMHQEYLSNVLLVEAYVKHTTRSMPRKLDMLDGIITGAVAERLGGTGYVCNTYCGVAPYPINIVRMFNSSDETRKRIVHSSLTELCSSHCGIPTSVEQLEDACGIRSQLNEEISSPSAINLVSVDESCNVNMEILTNTAPSPKTGKSVKAGERAPHEAVKTWNENEFSSLIIAAPDLDAWVIVKELLPLLSYSAPFVIYHQYLQPLARCLHSLQIEKMAINLQISES